MNLINSLIIMSLCLSFLCCSCAPEDQNIDAAVEAIDLAGLTGHIQILASDEFEGRSPSSEGEKKTLEYLIGEFKKTGCVGGNNGSFLQEVPLVEMTTTPAGRLEVKGTGRGVSFAFGPEYVALTRRMAEKVAVKNSELVFAGYGVVAPEYGWNDYEGLDVKGKTVIVLVNDPGYATKDSALFNGRAMTYYGRWTYKYEEAARQGAEGIFIVHETAPAGYPWPVVQGGWTGPQFYLEADDKNMSRCALEGWISTAVAKRLFAQAGLDFGEQKGRALQKDFQPTSLGLQYSLDMTNQIKSSLSNNVAALYEGTDLKDEVVIYSAHWDHFGVRADLEGDQILNGARDNATGTAALLELAEGFSKLPQRPRRSILFLAVTAEEQGLLGSAYYAGQPLYPVTQTVAALNMDALNIWGKMKDITIIGEGNSELDEYVYAAAKKQNRYVRPDPEPEKGIFYRSDHFSFAKEGIPALYTKMGVDHVTDGVEPTLEKVNEWTRKYYHKPGDEYEDWWDLTGCIDDVRLMFEVGYRISNEAKFPQWREGTEFKAKRDADMKAAGR